MAQNLRKCTATQTRLSRRQHQHSAMAAVPLHHLDASPALIAAAERARLASAADVLHLSAAELARRTGLSAASAALLLRASAAAVVDAAPVTALQLLQSPMQRERLAFGCAPLDALLRGGLCPGLITEITGSSAVGKTQLCLTAVHFACAIAGNGALFVDCCASFSSIRLLEMDRARISDPPPPADESARWLSRLQVSPVHSIHALLALLDTVVQNGLGDSAIDLIIVDSVAAIGSSIVGGGQHQGAYLLSKLGVALRSAAETLDAAVLVTNTLVSGGDAAQMHSALGASWRVVPDTRVLLERADLGSTPSHVVATVLHSSQTASGAQCGLTLTEAGVVSQLR
eukprot:m.208168 g.208168  ORF g.208168 m.208168 type:complete len:343 (-) comp10712_c0_seq8:204-1232(-)